MGSNSPFGDLKPKLTSQKFDYDSNCWFDFQPLKPRKQRVKWHLVVTNNPKLNLFFKILGIFF
jgi:hypothetical protein